MTTVLYADVLFIINFSMDFISLYLTAKLMSLRQKAWRYVLSAVLGAVSATVMTAYGISGLPEAALTLALSAVMSVVAYGGGSVGRIAGRSLALWGAGALVGGVVTVLCSLGKHSPLESARAGTDRPFGAIAVGVLIVWAFVRVIRPRLGKKAVEATVAFGKNRITLTALCDSGNLCTDMMSGDVVTFICSRRAEELFGNELARALTEADANGIPPPFRTRFRIVPVSGLGGRRIAAAIYPDEIVIRGVHRRALVAVADVGDGDFGGCDMLIPNSLL